MMIDGDVVSDSRVLKMAAALQKKYTVLILGRGPSNLKFTRFEYHGERLNVKYLSQRVVDGGKIRKLLGYMKFQFRLGVWLVHHRNEYDVIHASHLETAWISQLLMGTKKRIVFDVPDYFSDSRAFKSFLRSIIKAVETFFLNRVDHVILASEDRINQIMPAHPKEVIVIYNSPDIPKELNFNSTEKTSNKKIKVEYIGGLTPYRLIPELLETVESDDRFCLEIAGTGVLKSQVQAATRRCNRITYLGEIPYNQVLKLEQKADLLTALYDPVLPNHRYASPNKFFEAMALGKPVIMIENSGMASLLKKYQVGIVITEPSQLKLAEGLDELVKQRDVWDIQGQRMRSVYKKKFSWEIMEQRLMNLYGSFED